MLKVRVGSGFGKLIRIRTALDPDPKHWTLVREKFSNLDPINSPLWFMFGSQSQFPTAKYFFCDTDPHLCNVYANREKPNQ